MHDLTCEQMHNTLGPFADPATEIATEDGAQAITLRLIRDGEPRTYVYRRDRACVESWREGTDSPHATYASLASLLASSELADLRTLARTQQRVLLRVRDQPYINPQLQIEPATAGVSGAGEQALHQLLADTSGSKSRLILLDGPAGIGKTRLLERLAEERASQYLLGRGRPVLLVSSHGRRLSNLPDTLAKTAGDLRARFTSEHVPILVREGVLDLAIDGFDELVDTDGYADAWYALRALLEQLDGRGNCVFAARDTFFDQQRFFERLQAKSRFKINLIKVSLDLISPQRAAAWLAERGWDPEDIASEEVQDLLRPGSYALRPYFLSQLAEHGSLKDLRSPREFLVARFLDREAALIAKMMPKDINAESARSGLSHLFQEAAFDMAERESQEIDLEYLALICELVFGQYLQPDDLRKLQYKVGSIGLLERTPQPSLVRFPHSELQYHFFAHGLLERLEKEAVPFSLRRGVFGADFLEVLQDVAESWELDRLRRGVQTLAVALERDFGGDRFATNGGAILLALLAVPDDRLPSRIVNLEITEGVLRDTCRRATIEDCTIYRLDARGADLRKVSFLKSKAAILAVDEDTLFGDTSPDVDILDVDSEPIREPAKIREWIESHRAVSGSANVDEDDERFPFEDYYDRVCRRALRYFWFREASESPLSPMSDPFWRDLSKILNEQGRLKVKTNKQAGGPPSVHVHVQNAMGLLQGTSEADREVRRLVRKRARELAG